MVLAKSLFSYKSLISQFSDRKVIKVYKAYCWGIPIPLAGTIDKPIANYLNKHGWEKDQLWSLEIKNRKDDIFNKDKIYNIDEIKKYIAYNKKIISNTEKSFAKIKEIIEI